MNRRISYLTILVAVWLLFPLGAARAQKVSKTNQFQPYWQVNVNVGPSLFFGDLKQKSFLPTSISGHSEWRLGAGAMLNRQFTSFFGLRFQFLYGQLSGLSTSANRYFQSDYLDFNLNGTFSLTDLIAGYNPERKLNVYLVAGLGLTNYNSSLYNLSNANLINKMGYGYGHGLGGRTLEGIMTGGLGLSYKINDQWSINLESVSHVLNSDLMDMTPGGSKHDAYNYTSLGVSMKFGQRKPSKPATHEMPLPKPFTPNPAVMAPANKEKAQNENMPVQPPKAADSTVETIKKAQMKQAQQKQEPVRSTQPVQPLLEYRVQIRARYQKPVSLDYLSKHYHISEGRIRIDMHNGYYIYTVGSYDTYQQARNERDILRTKNGVSDAFVVAFKNNRRLDKLPKTR